MLCHIFQSNVTEVVHTSEFSKFISFLFPFHSTLPRSFVLSYHFQNRTYSFSVYTDYLCFPVHLITDDFLFSVGVS